MLYLDYTLYKNFVYRKPVSVMLIFLVPSRSLSYVQQHMLCGKIIEAPTYTAGKFIDPNSGLLHNHTLYIFVR
jgi:hypothetical protein